MEKLKNLIQNSKARFFWKIIGNLSCVRWLLLVYDLSRGFYRPFWNLYLSEFEFVVTHRFASRLAVEQNLSGIFENEAYYRQGLLVMHPQKIFFCFDFLELLWNIENKGNSLVELAPFFNLEALLKRYESPLLDDAVDIVFWQIYNVKILRNEFESSKHFFI